MSHELVTETIPTTELHTYHRNPRQSDTSKIAASLRVNGQYRPLVANRGTHTGRTNEVLAGNHTLQAARDEGWDTITVCWIDVDDDQAARIVAADNRTSDLATNDDRILAELLSDLDGLDGTGYDETDLDGLLSRLDDTKTDPWAEWDNMPDYESENQMAWQTVKVHFRNQADRDAFAKLVNQPINDTTKYVWHPRAETDHVSSLEYVGGD